MFVIVLLFSCSYVFLPPSAPLPQREKREKKKKMQKRGQIETLLCAILPQDIVAYGVKRFLDVCKACSYIAMVHENEVLLCGAYCDACKIQCEKKYQIDGASTYCDFRGPPIMFQEIHNVLLCPNHIPSQYTHPMRDLYVEGKQRPWFCVTCFCPTWQHTNKRKHYYRCEKCFPLEDAERQKRWSIQCKKCNSFETRRTKVYARKPLLKELCRKCYRLETNVVVGRKRKRGERN